MKSKSLALYYLCLVLITGFQILTSVFHGSLMVHQSYRIAQLNDQQKELKAEETKLESKIMENESLAKIDKDQVATQFETIKSPLAISAPTSRLADSSL